MTESRLIFDHVKSRNAALEKKNEECFTKVSQQIYDLHELTKLEPELIIELAQAKEKLSRRIALLDVKNKESADLLKIAEIELFLEELIEEKNALDSQLNELNLKNVEVPGLEKNIASLTADIEIVEKDNDEKERLLVEMSSSKCQKTDAEEKSEDVLNQVEVEVAKRLKKEFAQMQKAHDNKIKEIQMNLEKIKDKKIVILEKSAHTKELESLQHQIAEKDQLKEIEKEKDKKTAKRSSLPPPEPRIKTTPIATKKPLTVPKQQSPTESHYSEQSDNMFEDLVSQSFRNYGAKPSVHFNSTTSFSRKETVVKTEPSQQYKDDDSGSYDDDNNDDIDDQNDEDYETEELSFIKVKTQDPKASRPVAPVR